LIRSTVAEHGKRGFDVSGNDMVIASVGFEDRIQQQRAQSRMVTSGLCRRHAHQLLRWSLVRFVASAAQTRSPCNEKGADLPIGAHRYDRSRG